MKKKIKVSDKKIHEKIRKTLDAEITNAIDRIIIKGNPSNCLIPFKSNMKSKVIKKEKPTDLHCKRPLITHLVNIPDPQGYKGAEWVYCVKARCEHEAVAITKKKLTRFKKFYMSAFEPNFKHDYKIGELRYHEGDERL